MSGLGRLLIVVGLLLVVCGAAVLLIGRTGFPLGRLPGDFSWRGKHTSVYFPLGSSILISVVLSVILYILSRLRR